MKNLLLTLLTVISVSTFASTIQYPDGAWSASCRSARVNNDSTGGGVITAVCDHYYDETTSYFKAGEACHSDGYGNLVCGNIKDYLAGVYGQSSIHGVKLFKNPDGTYNVSIYSDHSAAPNLRSTFTDLNLTDPATPNTCNDSNGGNLMCNGVDFVGSYYNSCSGSSIENDSEDPTGKHWIIAIRCRAHDGSWYESAKEHVYSNANLDNANGQIVLDSNQPKSPTPQSQK